jgi:hypothetical protein
LGVAFYIIRCYNKVKKEGEKIMNLKQKKTRIAKLKKQILLAKEMYKKEIIREGTYNNIIKHLQKEITELTG